MSLAGKRRTVHVGLVLFTLWPLVHIYLVMHFNLSAWKLAGWGMYATPRPSFSGIEVLGRRPGSQQFEKIRSVPPQWRAEASQFLDRQQWLGELTRPNELARACKTHMPEFSELRIIVYTPTLDRQTAIVVMRESVYDYP